MEKKELKIALESSVINGACHANANNLIIGCNGRNWCL